jgi:hypothetical protein
VVPSWQVTVTAAVKTRTFATLKTDKKPDQELGLRADDRGQELPAVGPRP